MRVFVVLAITLLVGLACATGPRPGLDSSVLPSDWRSPAAGGLRLKGQASGPMPGLGPELDIDAFVRADGWLRAELRYQLPDGRPGHDVLIWTPEVALLADHRRGDLSLLGDAAGDLDAEGTRLRASHVVWLALARAVPEATQAQWRRDGSQWRGQLGPVGMRVQTQPRGGRWSFSELAWQGEADAVRSLRAQPSGFVDTPWGAIPTGVSLEGSLLEARVQVDWSVEVFESMEDTIFDPLWRP